MKKPSISLLIGVSILLSCFVTGIRIRDYILERNLRQNLQNVQIGMTDEEVIQILGEPTNRISSDNPSSDWCFDTNTIALILEEQPEIHCGEMLLQMTSARDGRVMKKFEFRKL